MKSILTFLTTIFLCCGIAQAQSGISCDTSDVFIVVDTPPQFPGGDEALMVYLMSNFQYPSTECGYYSSFYISFVIDTTGQVVCTEILRPEPGHCILQNGFGESLLALFNQMPHWEPGVHNGRKVKVRITVPLRIDFR